LKARRASRQPLPQPCSLWQITKRRSGFRIIWFHTGAPVSERPEHALFAIIDAASLDPALARFALGEDRYPDRSATLIALCPSLENGTPLMVTGPGIESSVNFAPQGIRNGFWDEFAANHERFPLGVDLLLVSGDQIVGLPRTSKVTPLDGAA